MASVSVTLFGICVGVLGVLGLAAFPAGLWVSRRSMRAKWQDGAESAVQTGLLEATKVGAENERRRADNAESELRKTTEQFQFQKTTSQQLENDNRRLQIGLDNFQKQYQNLQKQMRQLENDKRDAETGHETAHKKSQALTKELKQKQLLLDGRTEELRGAQAFLTTADQYAVADVIRLVEHLNAEIMQVAAAMVDELNVEKIKNEVPLGDGNEVVMRVDRILGVATTKLLRKSGDHLLILVQTAFQTSMVSYTKRIVSSWSSDADVIEDTLTKIYAQVRETGKWIRLSLCSKSANLFLLKSCSLYLLVGSSLQRPPSNACQTTSPLSFQA